ncbi:hypothetical protein IFM89_001524 [Coptis chinensis]|uniref:O-fucosyltransferase family protein n=1 Tax=Coptis chinensis TaxID=261450 RepID=A0A835I0L6_9MAGN|nr:hypothetical protein IFM89_001524 [Coptis chinensis]
MHALANNGLPTELQKLKCRINFQPLKFTPQIEALGNKLVRILQRKGSFVALHLRYEMDMLAFSGCSHGCSEEEADELKRMRYAYPWWREKELVSEERRSQGTCPLTPEETALVLQALGFGKSTHLYNKISNSHQIEGWWLQKQKATKAQLHDYMASLGGQDPRTDGWPKIDNKTQTETTHRHRVLRIEYPIISSVLLSSLENKANRKEDTEDEEDLPQILLGKVSFHL